MQRLQQVWTVLNSTTLELHERTEGWVVWGHSRDVNGSLLYFVLHRYKPMSFQNSLMEQNRDQNHV